MEIKLSLFLTHEEKKEPFDEIEKKIDSYFERVKKAVLDQVLKEKINETSSPGLTIVAKDKDEPKDN